MSNQETRFASQGDRFQNRFNSNRPAGSGPPHSNSHPYRNNDRNMQRSKTYNSNTSVKSEPANSNSAGSEKVGDKPAATNSATEQGTGDHTSHNNSETKVKTESRSNESARQGADRSASSQRSAMNAHPNPNADTKKKFTGRCRLFFGNIPISLTEEEFVHIIKPYGDNEDLFLNSKKGFGFVKLETRAAAEACKNGLDGIDLQGRSLRVRYATHSAALQVKNLSPHCTNEVLAQAFGLFGEVERAVVVVDDRGKSQGTGIVEFSRRAAFSKALDTINKGVFLISKSLRPVCVEPLDQKDEEDGLPEKYATKSQEWVEEMSIPPRLAEMGSYEYDIGMKWKELEKLELEKKAALEDEMTQKRLEMELDMEAMIHEHKANMLRQDMMKRQAELNALESQRRHREEQKLRELEMRRMQMNNQQQMPQMGGNRNMGGSNQMGGASQMGGMNQANRMSGHSQMGGGNQMMGGGGSQMMGGRGGNSGGGFSGTEQELLMHQQQALRERQQQAFREMHMKQQQGGGGGGGGQGSRPMQPPPNPPQYMQEGGRGGSGMQGGGSGGGRIGGPGMMGGSGNGMNQGGGMAPGGRGGMRNNMPEVRSSRFDQPPSGNPGGAQGMQGGHQGMQQRQGIMNNIQQQMHQQQQNQMYNQGAMGPGDPKRPRRF